MKKIITTDYFAGIGIFLIILLSFFGLIYLDLNTSKTISYLLILIVILSAVFFILKKPYIALGLITGAISIILLVAMFIVELTLHPPDEE